jgi:phosphatidylserine/phosphatidylglycerophosphate/cardiolipin synthase-like enzyme
MYKEQKEGTAPSHFALLSPQEYLRVLRENVPQAQQRFWLKTFNFEADENFKEINQLLLDAAGRGLDTRFTVDGYFRLFTQGVYNYMPHLPTEANRLRDARRRGKARLFDQLSQLGVRTAVTHEPLSIRDKVRPVSGRDHIKMGIIDDRVAFLGGLNLTEANFSRLDFMVMVTQPELITALTSLYEQDEIAQDYAVFDGSNTHLLVDAGNRGESLILDQTIAAINNAQKSVGITKQFTPDGPIVDALQYAYDRGVEVDVLLTNPERYRKNAVTRVFDGINRRELRRRHTTFPMHNYSGWLHANAALIDDQIAVVGTHNFSGKGVERGNREANFLSTDSALVTNLSAFISMVKQNSSPR